MSFDALLAQAPAIARLDYPWDDWNVFDAYQDYATGREDDIEALSDAAKLALAIGLGEWLFAALRDHDIDHSTEQQLGAAWSTFSDTHFPIYWEVDAEEWAGPYRGVLSMVITLLNDAIFCLHESPVVGMRPDWLLMYCQVIFADRDPFAGWFERALVALATVPGTEGDDPDFDPLDPRMVYRPPVSRLFLGDLGVYDEARERARVAAYANGLEAENPLVEQL
jgi:hypothetical protein